MATQKDIQHWQKNVYRMNPSLKKALGLYSIAPTNVGTSETKLEVLLFRAMIDYFAYNLHYKTKVIRTDETHQHYVDYVPLEPYYDAANWGQSVRKEISDVFFLVFSPKRQIARMTHLQAKLEDVKWSQDSQVFRFGLDVGQYHLLHNRLEIKDTHRIYPDDILSFPLYSDSVSSYGVFYKDMDDKYDMAYEIASLISYSGKNAYPNPNAKRVHSFATTKDLWGYCNIKDSHAGMPLCPICWHIPFPICEECSLELLSTVDISHFERELFDLRIGTRVEFDVTTMRSLAKIFANNDLNAFINENERKMLALLGSSVVEKVNRYHRREGNQIPPEDALGEFDMNEVGGTYILINVDKANIY